jgi:hypothetical protein
VAGGNQLLANVPLAMEQLGNGPAIAVCIHPADGNGATCNCSIESCFGSKCWHGVGIAPAKFIGADAGQSDAFAGGEHHSVTINDPLHLAGGQPCCGIAAGREQRCCSD